MPDEVNPVVAIMLGGKERHLKCTLNSIIQFKELTKIDIHRDGVKILKLEADQFRALVWSCLIPEERKELTLEAVGEMIDRHNIFDILPVVVQAIAVSLPKAKKEGDKKEKAPLAGKVRAG